MRLPSAPTEARVHTDRQSKGDTRLRGRWLVIARLVWVVLFFITLGLTVTAFLFQRTKVHVVCATVTCAGSGSQPIHELVQQLHSIGLTLDFYVAFSLTIQIIFALGYFTVAAVIFWRKSDDWMALLVALFLATFVLIFADVPRVLTRSYPAWGLLIACMGLIAEMVFPLSFYLFPDGRFVPRWTRWFLIGWFAWGIFNYFFPDSPLHVNPWFLLLESLAFVSALGSIVVIQLYRYRYVSSPLQRQQTKWFVFGMIVGLGGFFGAGLLGFILPYVLSGPPAPFNLLSPALIGITAITFSYLVMLAIPISIGFSILRYRLWDIDLVINRTLVYSVLTGMLALVYFILIIALQFLVRSLTGQVSQSPLVIVASTLAIAALFQPLRHRIQAIIDRRFYRRKYDAAQALAAFSATLRNQVDLNQLSEQLVAVVEETMQPTFVSLWLRPPEHDETHRVPWRAKPPVSREGR
jgi:hypothetical protein